MALKLPNLIKSTAGAVPVLNDKGELTMQKVKVTRYVSGRRPEYAPSDSETDSSEDEEGFVNVGGGEEIDERGEEPEQAREVEPVIEAVADRRLRRLRERQLSAGERRRERDIDEPEVLYEAEDEEEEDAHHHLPAHQLTLSDSESEGEDLDDEAIERRRAMIREKAKKRALEDDVLDVVDEAEQSESEESEYEEYTDSEDETGPRLKPVFVRKMDRVTIREREEIENEEERAEKEKQRQTDLRKRESRRLVEQAVARELQAQQGASSVEKVVNTDDENDEEEYEAWKVRELKRIKRDREEREKQEKEKEEVEKLHNMTEEERRAYTRNQPKHITNKQAKGKYKFLQKYYHRGAFYLDEEEDVLKRDFGQATLEDHFDKTVLPKVMQVKDFGRAGRTKYTHLVDQDTTEYENPWSQVNPINLKFQNKGGGTKQVFDKPSYKKRKLG